MVGVLPRTVPATTAMHPTPTTAPHATTTDSGERPLTDTGNRAVITHYLAGDSQAADAYLSFYTGSRFRLHRP
jgi:hypothetical protein